MTTDSLLEIAWTDVKAEPDVEETIRECAARLSRHAERMTSLRVVVSLPHRHHENGNGFDVRVDVGMKGAEFIVHRHDQRSSDDLTTAVRGAFAVVRRRLDEHHRKIVDAHRASGTR